MTKLEEVARALAVHQFGNPDSWADQIPMARVAVKAMWDPSDTMCEAAGWHQQSEVNQYQRAIDAILSEKPE